VIVWIDGQLRPLDEARVSPLDHGITVGDGVFETMRVYAGVPFAWRRHLDRLDASASGLGLPSPDRHELRAATAAVLDANGLADTDARVRITVTGGPTAPGSSRHGAAQTTVFVTATPFEPAAPTADVVIAPWTRNEHGALAGLKTISYLENGMGLRHAAQRGAEEGIFANTVGNLCEGCGTNIFVVQDGELVTPPLTAGCLAGVTRGLVLEWVPGIAERDLPIEVLATCEEAFITSTSRDVHPIVSIDGRTLAEAPGSMTAEAMRVFAERAAACPDP
jgi:branched-chain amino acid aminotransferase